MISKKPRDRILALLNRKQHTAQQLIKATKLGASTVHKHLAEIAGLKSAPAPRTGERGRPAKVYWVAR